MLLRTETFAGAAGSSWSSSWSAFTAGASTATLDGNGWGVVTTATTSGRRGQVLTDAPVLALVDLVVDFRVDEQKAVTVAVAILDDGSAGATTLPGSGFSVEVAYSATAGSGALYLNRRSGNSSSGLSSLFNRTFTAGVIYRLRFQRFQGLVRYKVWDSSGAEPAAFTVSVADSTAIPAGRVRLGVMGTNASVFYRNLTISDFTGPVFDPTLSLTPAEDTPTFIAQQTSAAATPLISGSAGFWREKRLSVAETEAGGSQTSTNGLDLDFSTRFAYPAQPRSVSGHPSNAGVYVRTTYKPGSNASVQAAFVLFAVDFLTSSPTVEFKLRAAQANPRFGLVFVNGRMVQVNSVPNPGSVASGQGWSMRLVFPDARPRRITVYGLSSVAGDFGGVAVEPGYIIQKPTTPTSKRIAVIGDSYSNGAGTFSDTTSTTSGTSSTETFFRDLAIRRGATEWLQYGIGSTGFVQDAGGATAGSTTFPSRVAEVMQWNPDEVWIVGGRNDPTDGSGVQAALEGMIDQIRAARPSTAIYVSNTSANSATGLHAALAAGAASRNVQYIQTDINSLPKISDNVHPSYAGHRTLASNILAGMGGGNPPKVVDMTCSAQASATSAAATQRASAIPAPSAATATTSSPMTHTAPREAISGAGAATAASQVHASGSRPAGSFSTGSSASTATGIRNTGAGTNAFGASGAGQSARRNASALSAAGSASSAAGAGTRTATTSSAAQAATSSSFATRRSQTARGAATGSGASVGSKTSHADGQAGAGTGSSSPVTAAKTGSALSSAQATTAATTGSARRAASAASARSSATISRTTVRTVTGRASTVTIAEARAVRTGSARSASTASTRSAMSHRFVVTATGAASARTSVHPVTIKATEVVSRATAYSAAARPPTKPAHLRFSGRESFGVRYGPLRID